MNSEDVTDPYGLVSSPVDAMPSIWFGDVDVSSALLMGNTTNHVNAMATAIIELDASSSVIADINYAAEVVMSGGDREVGRVFTGYVVRAVADDKVIRIECEGQPTLRDPLKASLYSLAGPLDNIYALLRLGGVPENRMQLHGLDHLPTETVEVLVPVDGMKVSSPAHFGPAAFLPPGPITHLTAGMTVEQTHIDAFRSAKAFAVTYVTQSRMYDAELAALDRIDVALAWANIRMRFAGAVTPLGTLSGWHRDRFRQRASRGPCIALRGLASGRRWVHHIAPSVNPDATLEEPGGAAASLVAADLGLRGAARAAARAIESTDPVIQVTAVSECLEFYAGSTSAPYGFIKSERKALLKAAKDFTAEKRGRVEQWLGSLNEPPLLRRLRFQLATDGVPMTEEEMAVLARVRDERNNVVHGKSDVVSQSDVLRAVTLVARIMVYASERRSHPRSRR